MDLNLHCRAISETKMANAETESRAHFHNLLAESCRHENVEPEATVCPDLSNRLDKYLDHFLPAYTRANLSALHHHGAYARASTAVFTLSALAIIIITVQHLFHLPHLLVVGELVCISMILIIFHWGNHSHWHRNWVDCRYFAERVRCGVHVAFLCGKSSVALEPRWTERMVEESWCNVEFLKLMQSRPHPNTLSDEHFGVLRHFMITHWFKDQALYHESIAKRKMHKHHVVSHIGETFFWLTLVTAILHLTPHSLRHSLRIDHILTDNLLTFIVIALPAVGTALAGVRGHFDFKKIATRSHMIAMHLEHLITEAEATKDLSELTLVVLQAEELMIQENAGWHLHTIGKVLPSE